MTSQPATRSSSDLQIPPGFWPLDPCVTFLNHGSFGSCPRPVLEFQRAMLDRLEARPVYFLVRELEPLMDSARSTLSTFIGAQPEDVVFVPNATSGVNTVLRSFKFEASDELLVTDHAYNACRNAVNFAAEQAGARVVVVHIPFPIQHPGIVVERVLERITPRTRLVILDHVTSQTAMVWPIEKLVAALAQRGVETLVDGAHAPGMVPVNLDELGAAYYTGNCHKWICAAKSAGFLHVRRDRQGSIRPLAISHGANSSRTDRSRFQIEFGWTGTLDPSAFLSVPEALRVMAKLVAGGWPEIMRRNRALALAGRQLICKALDIPLPCPDEMIGSLASMPLPDATYSSSPGPGHPDRFQDQLLEQNAIEVPCIPWPAWPKRLVRISAQLYNSLPQYQELARALAAEFHP
ncbi:MAG: isopenicillin-N epimerase [Verrucomicrobiota bacterium]|jgi:isopenicillin-N epimerase